MNTGTGLQSNGRPGFFWLGVTVLWLLFAGPLPGIIFYTTADPTYNTSAPAGVLQNSGWQWQGDWGGFTATIIGPHHFIAASHIGGSIGQTFLFNGSAYVTTAVFDDPSTDLVIWQVSGTFPTWAPLYRSTDELNKSLVVFGRGVSRGGAVTVAGVLKGWNWGGGGGVLRWGENRVASFSDLGVGLGAMLYATFDAGAGPNEAHFGSGDSSSAIFIQEGGEWKLAGIGYAVDASFNTTNTGDGFIAALFDVQGLYIGHNGSWQFVPVHVPTGFYASRISSRIAWIDGVVPPSEIAPDVPLLSAPEAALLVCVIYIIGAAVLRRPENERNRA